MSTGGQALSLGERLYRLSLRAYPADFRDDWGDEMLVTLEARLLELRAAFGPVRMARFWAAELAAVVRTAARLRLQGERSGARVGDSRDRTGIGSSGGGPSGRGGPHLRDSRHGAGRVETMARDFRWAFRTLAKSPGSGFVVILTLGLAIGANSAVFSVVNGVLLKPLPYPDGGRIVTYLYSAPGLDLPRLPMTTRDYMAQRDLVRGAAAFGVHDRTTLDLSGAGDPERLSAASTSAGVFEALGVAPALGRTIRAEDEQPSAPSIVVLSHAFWERRFGRDPGVVGMTLILDEAPRQVVGVMPERFRYPDEAIDVWVPLTADPDAPLAHTLTGVSRLGPGVEDSDFRAELAAAIASAFDEGIRARGRFAPLTQSLQSTVVGDVGRALWLLLGTVGFVLLVACVNVANLFLVRVEGRMQDQAVKRALGATRWDVARAGLAESALLCALGGALGLALGSVGLRLITGLAPAAIPRASEIGLDLAVVVFTAATAAAAAIVFGSVSLVRPGGTGVHRFLVEGAAGVTGSRARNRLRGGLVVAQVGLAIVLLVGAGLMVRTFWSMRSVDPGFDPNGVFTARVVLPESRYGAESQPTDFFQQLIADVVGMPGVIAAGAANRLPLGPEGLGGPRFEIEGRPLDPEEPGARTNIKIVAPGYFEAMGIGLVEGRYLDADDNQARTNAIVVNRAWADLQWPGQSALGRRVRVANHMSGPGDWLTVVGVSESVRDRSLAEPPEGLVYFPLRGTERAFSGDPRAMTLVIRTAGNPAALADPVVRRVRELDPNLPVAGLQTMRQLVDDSMARTSFTMVVLGVAALMALLLGAVGLYGVLSYVVTRRTREIGVRIALGAGAGTVRLHVLKNGMFLAAVGVILGLVGGAALARFLEAFLYGVGTLDPATYGAVAVLLLSVALVATWLPARRASRVDPLIAIRVE